MEALFLFFWRDSLLRKGISLLFVFPIGTFILLKIFNGIKLESGQLFGYSPQLTLYIQEQCIHFVVAFWILLILEVWVEDIRLCESGVSSKIKNLISRLGIYYARWRNRR